MLQPSLNAFSIVRIESDMIEHIDFQYLIKDFAEQKARKSAKR